MKHSTKNMIALPTIIFTMLTVAYTWYFIFMRPQVKVAENFLEALRTRNENLLKESVVAEEVPVYKGLYLRNGFNKHLLSYKDLQERDSNNHFFPNRSRYSVEVEEDDVFFGQRKNTYFIAIEKKNDRWWVIQFSTLQDYDDLKQIQSINPPKTPNPGEAK